VDISSFCSFQSGSELPSASPYIPEHMQVGLETFKRFWSTGSAEHSFSPKNAPYPNPLFAYTYNNDFFNLHYGSNPVDGFHLAPAYLDIDAKKSPGFRDIKGTKATGRDVEAAKFEFLQWVGAFRAVFQNSIKEGGAARDPAILIYSCYSDALDFCAALGALQLHNVHRMDYVASGFSLRPFVFTDDYRKKENSRSAPILFDVIETSNLSDHTGLLNLVTLTSCLLKPSLLSVLSTDSLVSHADLSDSFDPMVALEKLTSLDPYLIFSVLGLSITTRLYPLTTTNSKFEELMSESLGRTSQGASQRSLNILWRPAIFFDSGVEDAVNQPLRTYVDDDALVELFLAYYQKTFKLEVFFFFFHCTRAEFFSRQKICCPNLRSKVRTTSQGD
jgi:hypothetical protein